MNKNLWAASRVGNVVRWEGQLWVIGAYFEEDQQTPACLHLVCINSSGVSASVLEGKPYEPEFVADNVAEYIQQQLVVAFNELE
jgi:hypothetical protein